MSDVGWGCDTRIFLIFTLLDVIYPLCRIEPKIRVKTVHDKQGDNFYAAKIQNKIKQRLITRVKNSHSAGDKKYSSREIY